MRIVNQVKMRKLDQHMSRKRWDKAFSVTRPTATTGGSQYVLAPLLSTSGSTEKLVKHVDQ